MEVSVDDAGSLTKKVTVVVPADTVSKKLDNAYRKLKADVSIRGFRKGKVPLKVLEKSHGEQVKAEIGEKLVQDTYFDAIEKCGLNVVVHPDIKSHTYADNGTFEYVAEVAVKPEFELSEYKGIKVELPEIIVTEEETEAALESLRKEMAPLKSVEDRGVQLNDIAVIDFQGFHENEALKEIQGQINSALNRAVISIVGYNFVDLIQQTTSSPIRDPDGITLHGVQTFKMLLQAE